MARQRKKLGEILVGWGTVTDQEVEQGLGIAKGGGKRLGEAMVEAGMCKEEDIAKALAAQYDMEYFDLGSSDAAAQIDMTLVPEDLVKKHLILPMSRVNGRLRLIIHDPMDLELLDLLRFRLNTEIDTVIAPKHAIKSFIDGGVEKTSLFSDDSLVSESVDVSLDASVDIAAGDDAPIIRLVHRIITEAVRNRASDIHVEPMEDRVLLRYRIDGVCHVRDNLPKRMQSALLARFKLMAGVNIAERRIPQDGRIKMPVDGEQIDFRVSCCPAYHGESIVLRILRPDSVKIGLVNLGFETDSLDEFNKIIRRPNGIFLVTGPTGSGKTTTLYSALDVLNRPDKKIITAEDPFSSILRAMLRQAPNIVLVGEIRDREVAEIAIQAALTGHLVFSTLHTNDAPSAITRLIDMGVKPFLVASSIQAIMAQRLIRVLCPHCRERDPDPDERLLKLVDITQEEAETEGVYRPTGCGNCGNTGFRGRKAIFEMVRMNAELRDLAFKRATVGALRDAALRSGMRDLLHDGKLKILRGVTTPEEVARFAQADQLLEANIDL
ncbi:MAG: GspE/PulE family protein [Planctomycetota bacterium]|jgi:type IV pilus assembly protein PilB